MAIDSTLEYKCQQNFISFKSCWSDPDPDIRIVPLYYMLTLESKVFARFQFTTNFKMVQIIFWRNLTWCLLGLYGKLNVQKLSRHKIWLFLKRYINFQNIHFFKLRHSFKAREIQACIVIQKKKMRVQSTHSFCENILLVVCFTIYKYVLKQMNEVRIMKNKSNEVTFSHQHLKISQCVVKSGTRSWSWSPVFSGAGARTLNSPNSRAPFVF